MTDPVVLTRNSAGDFRCFVVSEGRMEEAPHEVAEVGEFEKECQVVEEGGETASSCDGDNLSSLFFFLFFFFF